MMRRTLRRDAVRVALVGLAFLVCVSPATGATLPAGFEEQTLAGGVTGPTAVAFAPDGRMFVAEKAGRVRVVTADGTLPPLPLIDLSSHVNAWGDRGLIGLAVDKDFASNGYLYLL